MKQLKARVIDIHSSNGNVATLTDEVQQVKAIVSEAHSSNGSIATLTDEVLGLKAKVNEVHSKNESIATLTDDEVQQLKAKLKDTHSINATLMELVQQLKVTATTIQVAAGSPVNQVPLDEVSSSHSYNTGQPSPKQCPSDDIQVSGERIIWGTHGNTVEKRVEETIARLTTLSSSDFIITKKDSDSVSQKWWFIIAAKESTLLKLQEEWHLVKAQTHWKLKTAPTDRASSSV